MTQEEIKNLIEEVGKKTWQFNYDRKMSYLRIKLFSYDYYYRELLKFFNVNLDAEIYRVKNGIVSAYYDKNDHFRAFSEVKKSLLNSEFVPTINQLKELVLNSYRETTDEVNNKPTEYSSLSNEELLFEYNKFCDLNRKISLPTWCLYLHFENALAGSLKIFLEEKIGEGEEVGRIIKTLSLPTKITPIDMYHLDLYKVFLGEQDVKNFIDKYVSWGFFDVGYALLSPEEHLSKIKDLTVEKARIFIDEIEKKYYLQNIEVEKIKNNWKEDDHVCTLINLYCLYADLKDWKNFYREQSSYKLKFLFEEIAKRLSFTVQEVSFLTEDEMKSVLLEKIIIKSSDIDRRIQNSAFIFLGGKMFVVIDSSVLEKIDDYLVVQSETFLNGDGAYKGVVMGMVKVIFEVDDLKKFNDGDILVTSTTRPDYLPYMKKAGGFITNEGGLLSHAAILARELKKPCIIGTKIATKVLKDGDLVEVDANEGIVKILNKS